MKTISTIALQEKPTGLLTVELGGIPLNSINQVLPDEACTRRLPLEALLWVRNYGHSWTSRKGRGREADG